MEQDLVVGEALEGEAAKGYDFKQNNSIAPDIRHQSEKPFGKTFRRHPPHRQHSCQLVEVISRHHLVLYNLFTFSAKAVVFTFSHGASHSKVSQLNNPVRVNQTISAGNVPVDISLL